MLTPLRWSADHLALLDQRVLPHHERWLEVRNAAQTAMAIRDMVVRGAPAIGIAAAYGLALEARRLGGTGDALARRLADAAEELRNSRPTAVNLQWAIQRMLGVLEAPGAGAPELETEAIRIHEEDVAANRRIGALGSALLSSRATVLTHCNAGALATGGYGTALGIIRAAVEGGKSIAVFAGETRPWFQGARLTAWELIRDGIDVTLIADSMAGHFFSRGTFDAVVVGADRIAANGDTANKIGTYPLAVLAGRHGVPFYVAAPIATLDLASAHGGAIPIEERPAREMLEMTGLDAGGEPRTIRIPPEGITIRHPAFDVTPADLITAIITERGIARAPFRESLARVAAGGIP